MHSLSTFTVWTVIGAGLAAAVTDVRKFKIPNVLTLPLLLAGLLYHTTVGDGIGFSLGGAACGFATLIVFYALGGVGAGDVKLVAALGAWLGAGLTVQVFLIAGIAAGVYGVVLLVWQHGVSHAWGHVQVAFVQAKTLALPAGERVEEAVQRSDRRRRLIPFGAIVAIAVLAVVLPKALWDFDGFRILWGS